MQFPLLKDKTTQRPKSFQNSQTTGLHTTYPSFSATFNATGTWNGLAQILGQSVPNIQCVQHRLKEATPMGTHLQRSLDARLKSIEVDLVSSFQIALFFPIFSVHQMLELRNYQNKTAATWYHPPNLKAKATSKQSEQNFGQTCSSGPLPEAQVHPILSFTKI